MLWKNKDSDIYYLSSQLGHGKGTPFHKYHINPQGACVQQNAHQYLFSNLWIGRQGMGEVDRHTQLAWQRE